MSVFTVYFCGTGSTRFDSHNENYWNGELVSTLAANTLDQEFAHWICVDGPGSGNLQCDEMTAESKDHPYAGALWGTGWETNVRHTLNMIKGQFEWQRKKLTASSYAVLKNAGVPIEDVEVSGSFWSRIYDYGDRHPTPQQLQQQIVNQFRKGGKIPSQVNMVGWSRGGISCHMLANAMLNDPELKNIPVNIFAIDPVPGMMNFQPERVKLGANVREYVGVYARDERSKGFGCVVPETDRRSKVRIYPMPGRHATLVGNAAADGAGGDHSHPEPGRVVRHMAEACLRRWGVKLDKCQPLTPLEVVQAHAAMEKDNAVYVSMRRKSYTLLTEQQGNDRYVNYGGSWVAFSQLKGAAFDPASGLSETVKQASGMYAELGA
ncbi:hypothetical protein PMM47T1_21368 [Pseudomonas sp. M47T1]|uniref:hypothetical protein n=1 Tax=unclassified Pseudomonas TaxID=196821 RepID=UPI00026068AB|nr:hypothetical protein [Pseudomonas sp. M47T1]EIK94483.1 hypothetical protein PMM47T1_21368 [Pseudomonas sp. M47T1]